MIIGFGFGSPLTAILMLVLTSLVSYMIYKMVTRNNSIDHYNDDREEYTRQQLRDYYYQQREKARELTRHYDLTDEEIERKIDEELHK